MSRLLAYITWLDTSGCKGMRSHICSRCARKSARTGNHETSVLVRHSSASHVSWTGATLQREPYVALLRSALGAVAEFRVSHVNKDLESLRFTETCGQLHRRTVEQRRLA